MQARRPAARPRSGELAFAANAALSSSVVVGRRCCGAFFPIPFPRHRLLQQTQLPAGRNDDLLNRLPRYLRKRIEQPQGLQIVPEKFKANGKTAGQWPKVHNPAAQGNIPFLCHLRFRLIPLLFEPFDQIQRPGVIALSQPPRAAVQFLRQQRPLQQRVDAGDDERGGEG